MVVVLVILIWEPCEPSESYDRSSLFRVYQVRNLLIKQPFQFLNTFHIFIVYFDNLDYI